MARAYRSFADFERDEIRPTMRVGFSVEDIDETSGYEQVDFDADPFDSSWEEDDEDEDDEDEDDEDDEEEED